MPNTPVDVNSWGVSACYPRRTFYPLSDGPSTRNHRITMADFRLCSACRPRSQAGLCHCTQQLMSDQLEPTFARLRYSSGGDRPSHTTHHAGSRTRITGRGYISKHKRAVFQGRLHDCLRLCVIGTHPSCTTLHQYHYETIVMLHGVFPSNYTYSASSRRIQFR